MADATATLPQAQQVKQPSANKPKRFAFQVLGGTHWEAGPTCPDCKEIVTKEGKCSKCEYDAKGQYETRQPVIRDIKYGPGRPAGDIVETNVDLAKLHNRPGTPPKFRRLGEEGVRDDHAAELTAERQRANMAERTLKSALEKMTRDGLVAWAEEQGIELKGAAKREDVLRIVLGSLA